MTDQKNTFLAIVLSAIVLLAWQYFVGMPQMEKQRQAQQQQQQQAQKQAPAPGTPAPSGTPAPAPPRPARRADRRPAGARARPSRAARCSPARRCSPRRPRVAVETPLMKGSIALKGGRIDDLALNQYRETVDPKSPPIVLLVAVRHRASVLCRVRLGRGRRRHRQAAERRDGVDARKARARSRPASR